MFDDASTEKACRLTCLLANTVNDEKKRLMHILYSNCLPITRAMSNSSQYQRCRHILKSLKFQLKQNVLRAYYHNLKEET